MSIPEDLPLDGLLNRQAALHSGRTFIKFNGKTHTFRDMDRLADGCAAFLRSLNVRKGDRVALLAFNSASYVAAYFGIIRAGCIVLRSTTF